MRPRTLDELVGQEHLLAPGRPLRRGDRQRRAAVDDPVGPARHRQDDAGPADRHGDAGAVRRLQRRALRHQGDQGGDGGGGRSAAPARASARSCSSTRSIASTRPSRTPFLPHVETGTVTLIGATTENPIVRSQRGAALARRVFTLRALGDADARDHRAPRPRRHRARPGRRRLDIADERPHRHLVDAPTATRAWRLNALELAAGCAKPAGDSREYQAEPDRRRCRNGASCSTTRPATSTTT